MTYKSLLISVSTALVLASCGGSADLTTTTAAPPTSVTVVTTSPPPASTTQAPTDTTEATTTSQAPTATTAPTTTTTPPTHTVAVADGSVVGGVERVKVSESEDVTIEVTTDVADELHIHGLDLFFDLEPGVNTVTFQPEARGIFEAELEGAGLLLFELQVS